MKKNQKIAIGVGVAILLYFLWMKSKDKNKVAETLPIDDSDKKNEDTTKEITETKPKIDTSDIPTECLSGFTVNGEQYFIKDNEFQKK